jgi:hypothetical protein
MKTFTIVCITSILILSTLLGYSYALGDGCIIAEGHFGGYAGAALFPLSAVLCILVGRLSGLISLNSN